MTEEYYEKNKEMNKECEEDGYGMTWPIECSGCLFRAREIDKNHDHVECIHPIFSRQSYQCPVRMTARAKEKFGRKKADDYI